MLRTPILHIFYKSVTDQKNKKNQRKSEKLERARRARSQQKLRARQQNCVHRARGHALFSGLVTSPPILRQISDEALQKYEDSPLEINVPSNTQHVERFIQLMAKNATRKATGAQEKVLPLLPWQHLLSGHQSCRDTNFVIKRQKNTEKKKKKKRREREREREREKVRK